MIKEQLKYKIVKQTADNNFIKVEIKLADDCKNGHNDFSITGELAKKKTFSDRSMISCGCIHKDILREFPEFKIFVDLHLTNEKGIPMFAVGNGFFHLERDKKTAQEYLRASDDKFKLVENVKDLDHFHYLIEKHFLNQWAQESEEAIKFLESLTGDTYLRNSNTSHFEYLSEAKIYQLELRIKKNYYSLENIKKREKIKAQEEKQRILKKLEEKEKKEINKIKKEIKIKKWFVKKNLSLENVIYYSHSDLVSIGWMKPLEEEEAKKYRKKLLKANFNYEVIT